MRRCRPGLLATVVVLRALQGLSDEEAVGALRFDLPWKAACGLGLYDQGFDPSLLTYFRRQLVSSSEPDRIFGIVCAVGGADRGAGGPDAAGAEFSGAAGCGRHPGHPSPSCLPRSAGWPASAAFLKGCGIAPGQKP
ncbi:transposase [[Actinomadura] parvosata]|uniref:transposase n=1 Tax=[Actinomadura] parvosata TaxID=1955412 RepID=UPI00406BFEA8